MSYFKPDPCLVLGTQADVLLAIQQSDFRQAHRSDPYRIKSLWLIDLIDEIERREYPYNATVKKLALERLGLPVGSEAELAREGDTLSLLIYNAQCYRRSDRLRSEGYEPFAEDVLQRAWNAGHKQIEVMGDNMFGGMKAQVFNIREIQGRLYAMPPRSRRRCVSVQGQPCRIVLGRG